MQLLIGIIGLVCAVWVIYEVWSQNTRLSVDYKILWTVGAILLSILTAIAYYFVEKRREY